MQYKEVEVRKESFFYKAEGSGSKERCKDAPNLKVSAIPRNNEMKTKNGKQKDPTSKRIAK